MSYIGRTTGASPRPAGSKTADRKSAPRRLRLAPELPLTLYLNATEIVTLMTAGGHPKELAIGRLVNEGMLAAGDEVAAIDHASDIDTIVVRTARTTAYEERMRRQVMSSPCAQGTAYDRAMEEIGAIPAERTCVIDPSTVAALAGELGRLRRTGAAAGLASTAALCRHNRIVAAASDLGPFNAIDTIAGRMRLQAIPPGDKMLLIETPLTAEIVMRSIRMEVSAVATRAGATSLAVEIAGRAGMIVMANVRGSRLAVLTGGERVVASSKRAGRKPSLRQSRRSN